MIAVDTNVVIRLLTQDDESQFNKSVELFDSQDIFIPDTVILEIELAHSQSYPEFYTFDEKFVKRAVGLTQCVVKNL